MEKYSKAVREVHLQFEKRESHPAEKYIGRLVRCGRGKVSEVVGYTECWGSLYSLIADATLFGGWRDLGADDIVFKDCESYWYVSINDLID